MRFYFHSTPNPMKVALMLEELELSPEVIPVDTRKGEQHAPDFLRVNPNAKLPAFVDDDGQVVFDSNAIVLHLAQTRGRFLPDAAQMGEALSWFFFVATGIGPYSGQAVHFTRIHVESAYATRRYVREVGRHYRVLDERLAAREWIGGAEYGICDIAAWGWIRLAGYVLESKEGLEPYANVRRWFERVEARPAAARAREWGGRFSFKKEMDETAMRAMFPQNY